jgi:REP element-mobilizing transposase RayT
MCRNRRDRRKPKGKVFFMTSRVIKGLPFVCRLSIEKVLTGILARAQGLYPVKICAYVFMGNHYHMIITGHSKHISPFMNYIQSNVAQSVKRFIPDLYESSIWDGRFKEQVLVTAEDVIAKMAYIYLNPVRARLTHKAKEYPGVSSYNHLLNDKEHFLVKWISVAQVCALPDHYKKKEDFEITRALIKDSSPDYS